MTENRRDSSNCCKFCGWEFHPDIVQRISDNKGPVLCEFCGIEINISSINIKKGLNKEDTITSSNIDSDTEKMRNSIVKNISKRIQPTKYSVSVISRDENFPRIFKENLVIVISRLIYFIILKWEQENNINVRRVSLEKSIYAYIEHRINPIIDKRVPSTFLNNLFKINKEDFEDWLRLLQKKIDLDQSYETHFKVFLTWLIKLVFKLVSDLWDLTNLPKLHETIRKDLKKYNFNSILSLSSENAEKKAGKIIDYSVVEFFRDINREISNIIGQKITYRVLSKRFLRMKSKWYVNDKILNSKHDNVDIFPWNLIKLYKIRLRETLGSNFNKLKKYFNKLQIYKKNSITNEAIEFNENYFKTLNTKTKVYFYGWLLAEGHVDKKGRRLIVEINVRDGEILKRFIKVLGLNPKKVNFKRRERNGKCFKFFVLEISSEIFVNNLLNLGFVRGKKSKKIRFPLSIAKNRELALACLLGFFDGDGSHGRTYPKSLPESERKFLRPYITSKSVRFLNDVKSIFNIRYNISGSRRLSIGSFLFLEMLENYKLSLDRKRYDGYLSSEDLIKLRTRNLSNSWLIPKRKFKLSENELTSLWEKGWSDEEIADYHEKKYNIKITERTVKSWRFEWKLFHSDPIFKAAVKANLIKKLLPLNEWTLEGIYTRKFGYTLDPSNNRHIYRFKKRLEEWFYNDPLIQESTDIVERIKEVYGI